MKQSVNSCRRDRYTAPHNMVNIHSEKFDIFFGFCVDTSLQYTPLLLHVLVYLRMREFSQLPS